MSISEELNKIKNAIYGREVRDAIHDGIKKTYDDASQGGNTNMEVSLARGGFQTLNERLTNVDGILNSVNTQLAQIPNDIKSAVTPKADKVYVDSKVNAMASGTPKIVVQTYADLPAVGGTEKLALVLDDGLKYYDDGISWVDAGIYQAVSLSQDSVEARHLKRNSITNDKVPNAIDLFWEFGAIDSQTGEVIPVAPDYKSRIMTATPIRAYPGLLFEVIGDNVHFNIYFYSLAGEYENRFSGWVFNQEIEEDCLIMISVKKIDGAEFETVENAANNLYSNGEGLSKNKLSYGLRTLMDILGESITEENEKWVV